MRTDTPRTDALIMECPSHLQEVALANLSQDLERELAASNAEVERLRDAFSKLTDEIECTSKCSSHPTNYCDCGRLARAYTISDSIAQNPTK